MEDELGLRARTGIFPAEEPTCAKGGGRWSVSTTSEMPVWPQDTVQGGNRDEAQELGWDQIVESTVQWK